MSNLTLFKYQILHMYCYNKLIIIIFIATIVIL